MFIKITDKYGINHLINKNHIVEITETNGGKSAILLSNTNKEEEIIYTDTLFYQFESELTEQNK